MRGWIIVVVFGLNPVAGIVVWLASRKHRRGLIPDQRAVARTSSPSPWRKPYSGW